MKTQSHASIDICAYHVGQDAPGYLTAAPAVLATPSQVDAGILSVTGARLAKHSQKRFAMAGTNTNVWPLGPQERSSG
jgi:hypothetical protein